MFQDMMIKTYEFPHVLFHSRHLMVRLIFDIFQNLTNFGVPYVSKWSSKGSKDAHEPKNNDENMCYFTEDI